MPITANFHADFSDFATAVAAAQTKLITFEDNANKVAGSLSKMEKSISGVAIVQAATVSAEAVERLGGVTRLTYAELQKLGGTAQEAVDKLRALGQSVPTGIQNLADRARGASEEMLRLAGATQQSQTAASGWSSALSTAQGVLGAFGLQASISGVVNFTKSVFDNASAIHDMGERLGISAEAVQGFKFAAEQAGSSMDTVGTAITKMNKNLAEGDKSTVNALKDAGLSFQAIRNMRPEDAFLAITDAIAKMPDPMEQSDVTLKLFGKSAAELLPAIKEGFRQAADGAMKMSNETVAALERAQDAWDKLGHAIVIVTGSTLATAIDAGTHVATSWRNFGQFVLDASKYGVAMATAMASVNEQLGTTVDFVGPLEDTKGKIHQTKEEADAAAAAFKKWEEATAELQTAGAGFQGTLDTIDGSVVEAIKFYLATGVAQNKLAAAYALTETQVKAVALAVEAEKKAVQDLAKHQAEADAIAMTAYTSKLKVLETIAAATAKAYGTEEQIEGLIRLGDAEEELTKDVYANITSEKERMKLIESNTARQAEIDAKIMALEEKRAQVVNAQVIAEIEAQKKLNEAYGLTVSGGIAQQVSAYDKLQLALEELHKKKVVGIDQTNQENLLYKQYTDSLLEAAKADDKAREAVASHNNEVAKVPGVMKAAEAATRSYVASNIGGAATGGSFQAPSFAGYLPSVQSFKLPSYAEGGVGDFGGGTLAVLHGLEAVVPLGSSGRGSGIGGTSVTVSPGAIVLNFPVMNDPTAKEALAGLIGDALAQKLRPLMRFPTGA